MAQPEYGARYLNGAGSDAAAVTIDGVFERAALAQRLDGLGHRRLLLADGDVDALHAEALLVEDRVDRDGGLARLAVADDQLALAPPDRGHGVDGLDAGLERLVHRLAAGDAGGLDLHAALDRADERTAPVEGLAQRVDDATEQGVADGHRQDPPGGPHCLALFDALDGAEHHRADRILFEVQSQSDRAVLELEQLIDRAAGQARHLRDAVADLGDAADRGGLERGVEVVEVALDRFRDVVGRDGELSHELPL